MRPLLLAPLLLLAAPAAAQTAEERLDALEARIERLEDMNQIERVQRTYGYFVDKGQWTELAELFTEDATLEIGGKGLFLGRHRVLEYMQTAFGPDGAKPGCSPTTCSSSRSPTSHPTARPAGSAPAPSS